MKPISVQDNFFDLGGHSLLAVRLWTRMEGLLRKVLPLSLLYSSPTVSQLAHAIRQGVWSPQWEYLIEVQPIGSRMPLFFVQGAGGMGFYLKDFANYLGPDQPLYTFQARGLDGKKGFHTSVEEMAKAYVTELCGLQPEGPYFLSGYSFGGVVAFEMAQQLHDAGKQVALLAVFDTPGPFYRGPFPTHREVKTFVAQLRRHLKILRLLTWSSRNQYIKTRLVGLVKGWWRGKLLKGRLLVCYAFRALNLPVPLIYRAMYMLYVTSEEVKAAYTFCPYAGELTIFQTEKSYSSEEGLGWKGVAGGGFEVKAVPGKHSALFREPYIQEVAESLRVCIENAVKKIPQG